MWLIQLGLGYMCADVWLIYFRFGLAKDFLHQWVTILSHVNESSASSCLQVSLHILFFFHVFGLNSVQMTGAWVGRWSADNSSESEKEIFKYLFMFILIKNIKESCLM